MSQKQSHTLQLYKITWHPFSQSGHRLSVKHRSNKKWKDVVFCWHCNFVLFCFCNLTLLHLRHTVHVTEVPLHDTDGGSRPTLYLCQRHKSTRYSRLIALNKQDLTLRKTYHIHVRNTEITATGQNASISLTYIPFTWLPLYFPFFLKH